MTYGTDNIIAEADVKIVNFKLPGNHNADEYVYVL